MNIAGTMLNICAILSTLKKYHSQSINTTFRHKQAIFYAKNAIVKTE
jgi:hypothetical protein